MYKRLKQPIKVVKKSGENVNSDLNDILNGLPLARQAGITALAKKKIHETISHPNAPAPAGNNPPGKPAPARK